MTDQPVQQFLKIFDQTTHTTGLIHRLQDLHDALTIYPACPHIVRDVNMGQRVRKEYAINLPFLHQMRFISNSHTELTDWNELLSLNQVEILETRIAETEFKIIGKGKSRTLVPLEMTEEEKNIIISHTPNVTNPHGYSYIYIPPVRNKVKPQRTVTQDDSASRYNMKIGSILGYTVWLYNKGEAGYYEKNGEVCSFLSIDSAYQEIYDYVKKAVGSRHNNHLSTRDRSIEYVTETYDPDKNYNKRNVIFPKPTTKLELEDHTAAIMGIYSDKPLQRLELHACNVHQYQPAYEEEELKVPQLKHRWVRINGISFLSSDLRLLYNTFLFDTLATTGESDVTLPGFTVQDLVLLRELFTGMSPLIYVYQRLSNYAYSQLSGQRTLFNLYDQIVVRILIDQNYSIGVRFRDQLKSIKVPEDLGKLVRLEELVGIASEA